MASIRFRSISKPCSMPTPLPEGLNGATARGWVLLRHSVVRTLMLHRSARFSATSRRDWVDLSALGHSNDQLTPMPVANWARAETDRMRLRYQRTTIPPGFSLPQFCWSACSIRSLHR